jgi:hypothetical protein
MLATTYLLALGCAVQPQVSPTAAKGDPPVVITTGADLLHILGDAKVKEVVAYLPDPAQPKGKLIPHTRSKDLETAGEKYFKLFAKDIKFVEREAVISAGDAAYIVFEKPAVSITHAGEIVIISVGGKRYFGKAGNDALYRHLQEVAGGK